MDYKLRLSALGLFAALSLVFLIARPPAWYVSVVVVVLWVAAAYCATRAIKSDQIVNRDIYDKDITRPSEEVTRTLKANQRPMHLALLWAFLAMACGFMAFALAVIPVD